MTKENKARWMPCGCSLDNLHQLGSFFIQPEKKSLCQVMTVNTDVTVITFIDINKPIGVNTGRLLSSASLFTNANRMMLLLIKAVTQVGWQLGHNIQRATWLPLWFNLMSMQLLFHRDPVPRRTLPVNPVCLVARCYQPRSPNPYTSLRTSTRAYCQHDQSTRRSEILIVKVAADQ